MVYVDFLLDHGWKYGKSCHLFSDTSIEELNNFAVSIGMKLSWLQQSNGGLMHYDLTKRKRVLALENGAKDVQTRAELAELFEICKNIK